jgi:hypothetical protein
LHSLKTANKTMQLLPTKNWSSPPTAVGEPTARKSVSAVALTGIRELTVTLAKRSLRFSNNHNRQTKE